MKDSDNVIAIISKIRNKANNYIEEQLHNKGNQEMITSHGSILGALYRNDGKLMMKDIAEKISRDKSTVTYLVNKLEDEGYIKKEPCPVDSRVKYIVLTEKGWGFQNDFRDISRGLMGKAYQGFNDREREELTKLLLRMSSNFSQSTNDENRS